MAISPTDPIETLTNAQCALLRDELLALLQAAGLAAPTVRQTRRRLRMGIDRMEDEKDEAAERALADADNRRRQAHEAAMQPLRQRRAARQQTDYGAD